MKTPPAAKPKRPVKRATKKQSMATKVRAPSTVSTPRVAQTKAPKPTLATKGESWKTKEKEVERMIAKNPENALRVACDGLDYSLELIWRLIEKKSLFEPAKLEDGKVSVNDSRDRSAACLAYTLDGIMMKVSKLALAGDPNMINTAWYIGTRLAKTVHDVALANPDSVPSSKSMFAVIASER